MYASLKVPLHDHVIDESVAFIDGTRSIVELFTAPSTAVMVALITPDA